MVIAMPAAMNEEPTSMAPAVLALIAGEGGPDARNRKPSDFGLEGCGRAAGVSPIEVSWL